MQGSIEVTEKNVSVQMLVELWRLFFKAASADIADNLYLGKLHSG